MGEDLAEPSKARSLVEGTAGEVHPQASSLYKERELGWLCGHSSWEGFCTESHS